MRTYCRCNIVWQYWFQLTQTIKLVLFADIQSSFCAIWCSSGPATVCLWCCDLVDLFSIQSCLYLGTCGPDSLDCRKKYIFFLTAEDSRGEQWALLFWMQCAPGIPDNRRSRAAQTKDRRAPSGQLISIRVGKYYFPHSREGNWVKQRSLLEKCWNDWRECRKLRNYTCTTASVYFSNLFI